MPIKSQRTVISIFLSITDTSLSMNDKLMFIFLMFKFRCCWQINEIHKKMYFQHEVILQRAFIVWVFCRAIWFLYVSLTLILVWGCSSIGGHGNLFVQIKRRASECQRTGHLALSQLPTNLPNAIRSYLIREVNTRFMWWG